MEISFTNILKWTKFTKRLWFKLAIGYTALSIGAMSVFIILLYASNDYRDFHSAVTYKNIEEQIHSERLSIEQAIQNNGKREWKELVGNNLSYKLTHLKFGNSTSMYDITNSSRPKVYIQITDNHGNLILRNPTEFTQPIELEFNKQQSIKSKQEDNRMFEKRVFWIHKKIRDSNNNAIGNLSIYYIAKFDIGIQVQSTFKFLLYTWSYLIIISIPIGIASGLLAAYYVTIQLSSMNKTIENWRLGNFKSKILLTNDNVLLLHSQYLNSMAEHLEMYLILKQNIAVVEERNRVARELHDTVKQKLFAVGLQIGAAKSKLKSREPAIENILEAEAINYEAQKDLLEIFTQIRQDQNPNIEGSNFIDRIVIDLRLRFKVNIEFIGDDLAENDNQNSHQIKRIIEEAIMNATNHGKANKIIIELRNNLNGAKLIITDNGNGFDINKKQMGYGIISMRERAQKLPQGNIEIVSSAVSGTQIILNWSTYKNISYE